MERHAVEADPKIKRFADEFGTVVEADRFRRVVDRGNPLQCLDYARVAIMRPTIDRRREPAEAIDNVEDADLAPVEQVRTMPVLVAGPDHLGVVVVTG